MIVRWRVLVLAVWALIIAFGGVSFLIVEEELGLPDYVIYNSESAQTEQLMHSEFPQFGNEQDAIVITSPRGGVDTDAVLRERTERIAEAVGRDATVTNVIGPYTDLTTDQISSDNTSTLTLVALNGDAQERSKVADRLQGIVDTYLGGTDYRGYLTGQSPLNNALTEVEKKDQETAEIIGLPIAFLVLLLTLRSLVASLIPLLAAVSGIVLSSTVILALTTVMNLDTFALVVATVLGLGVGIDYALFVVSRFQEELARGRPVPDAVTTSMRTSGRTVLTAGFIVIIALGSLLIMRGHLFVELPVVSTIVVLSSMIASVTLLPALLATLGHRVNALRPRLPEPIARRLAARRAQETAPVSFDDALHTGIWARVSSAVMRRPILATVPALLALLLCAAPLLGIRLGLDLGLSSLNDTKPGIGQHTISQQFGAGAVSPVQIAACAKSGTLDDQAIAAVGQFTDSVDQDRRVVSTTSIVRLLDETPGGRTQANLRELSDQPGFSQFTGALVGESGSCAYISAQPASPVDSQETLQLVDDLRAMNPPLLDLNIGGMSAQYRDMAGETAAKLGIVVAVVVVLSFIYLVIAFRSIVLPLKATLLNVLATAASIGVTVAVFQFGWGENIFDFESAGSLQAFLPVALFAILFGLSMDYEVLIVSRIREQYLKTGNLKTAVPQAMQSSGKQVTAAAAIMAAVFGSLVLADVLELKQLGFGLALAVLLDATIVRMVLVPGAMMFFGDGNWWIPKWLEKRLPAERAHG
ncbi:hypothetical protein GS4_23_00180 [Gordonia soli NBRC 108243]|uniref:Membrane transport protein MMPL domain-containing protein n=1 Tax=Gordonia soli NBRC 108243 TaxID=1223545 RepID=M0QLC2_9ACTN|nr:hypothetical protein GS4_23_00180 [Gordonia soli NBRC 108243]